MATATLRMPRPLAESRPAAAAPTKGWFMRFLDRLVETRLRQAELEINRHRHLLPDELERAAYRLDRRVEDQLPFVR